MAGCEKLRCVSIVQRRYGNWEASMKYIIGLGVARGVGGGREVRVAQITSLYRAFKVGR